MGPAADGLGELIAEGAGPFDLVFIDADKASTPTYFELSLKLVRPGGIILVDNVVRDGALVDESTGDEGALGMRRFHELAGRQPGVRATTIQTVGAEGLRRLHAGARGRRLSRRADRVETHMVARSSSG